MFVCGLVGLLFTIHPVLGTISIGYKCTIIITERVQVKKDQPLAAKKRGLGGKRCVKSATLQKSSSRKQTAFGKNEDVVSKNHAL